MVHCIYAITTNDLGRRRLRAQVDWEGPPGKKIHISTRQQPNEPKVLGKKVKESGVVIVFNG